MGEDRPIACAKNVARVADGESGASAMSPTPSADPSLTLANARTPEERAEVIAHIRKNGRRLRELLKNDLPSGTDELYGDDGLPA